MNPASCFCAEIPSLSLKTRVSVLIHAKELKRTTNTGQLATLALINSQLHVRGRKDQPFNPNDCLDAAYQSILFFPSDDAVDLTDDLLPSLIPALFTGKPINLIVPDGNWRQASKVHTRYPEFANLPRVKISAPNPSQYFLRKETMPEGMATLQAIAEALGVIEGLDVRDQLAKLYEVKLMRTIRARGIQI
jgi:DTW domain-containing protein YfiP